MSEQIQLPEPDAAALEHCARVTELILERVARAGGWLDFSEFMELALYAPGLGYYSAGAQKFGEAGDFTTAPEISPLFATCVARALLSLEIDNGMPQQILELGAGSGVMAAGILETLERYEALPERYFILEVSADLRERQRVLLSERVPDLSKRVVWLDTLPAEPLDGAIIANEVLDALPVSRFHINDRGELQSLGVAADEGRLYAAPGPASAALADFFRSLGSLPAGYTSEWCPSLSAFVAGLSKSLGRGSLLFIDYGLARKHYYSPDRASGTLACHYRHRMHADPFLYPGLQDITAWVDFTAAAQSASGAGMDLLYFTSQAHFLMAAGLEQEFARLAEEHADDQRQLLSLSSGLKALTLPGQMGENFKILALGRDKVCPAEFQRIDQAHML